MEIFSSATTSADSCATTPQWSQVSRQGKVHRADCSTQSYESMVQAPVELPLRNQNANFRVSILCLFLKTLFIRSFVNSAYPIPLCPVPSVFVAVTRILASHRLRDYQMEPEAIDGFGGCDLLDFPVLVESLLSEMESSLLSQPLMIQ